MAGSIETKAISASNLKLKLKLTEAELGKRRYFKEARKEEELVPLIPAPETRTSLCSFAKRFIKIG